jgi:hypothetical protein
LKNSYEIRGDVTAIFLVYKGERIETLVDTSSLKKLSSLDRTWFVCKSKDSFYVASATLINGKYERIYLHRFISEPPPEMVVDHINHNTLDNRSCNLRNLTVANNGLNRKGLSPRNKSGVRGVYFHKRHRKWYARIGRDGKTKFIGSYDTMEEAKAAHEAELKRNLQP